MCRQVWGWRPQRKGPDIESSTIWWFSEMTVLLKTFMRGCNKEWSTVLLWKRDQPVTRLLENGGKQDSQQRWTRAAHFIKRGPPNCENHLCKAWLRKRWGEKHSLLNRYSRNLWWTSFKRHHLGNRYFGLTHLFKSLWEDTFLTSSPSDAHTHCVLRTAGYMMETLTFVWGFVTSCFGSSYFCECWCIPLLGLGATWE